MLEPTGSKSQKLRIVRSLEKSYPRSNIPHWVLSESPVAISVRVSFLGLRRRGRFEGRCVLNDLGLKGRLLWSAVLHGREKGHLRRRE